MKLMHLSDLHLGKRVNGFSMLDDQRFILDRIVHMIETEKPDAIMVAGDVYDRVIPPEEAVNIWDDFLVKLSRMGKDVLIISGNHDSEERVAWGGRLMETSGIHLAPVYRGQIKPVELEDEYGKVAFWLIPFLKPAQVRHWLENDEIRSYTEAMQAVVDSLELDPNVRNVAISHQFITGAHICDSEEHSVGGLDEISADVYEPFDYVALGHLHGPQAVGRETVRYAGSPLKYSFSEANQKKSVTLIEMGEKGQIEVRLLPLEPMTDMVRLSGAFADLMEGEEKIEDYCEITLTDEQDVLNAVQRLRVKYPNIMQLRYDNTRTKTSGDVKVSEDIEKKSQMELFNELYQTMNGQPVNEEQEAYLMKLIEEIWRDEA